MATRSRTLRKLPPTTRKYARLLDELQSVLTRLKNYRPVIQDLELVALAEAARELHQASADSRQQLLEGICHHHFSMAAPARKECLDCLQTCPYERPDLFDHSISTVSTGEGKMP